jgi:TDG/mug DNA glycosylase family protein
MSSELEIKCFDPIVDKNSRILILGTMPGAASLKAKHYYDHPNNLFWDIMFRLCNPDWKIDSLLPSEYSQKQNLLISNGIALWDVLQFCERKGSPDKHILNQINNNFDHFFRDHPSIKTVFFNGKKASEYFSILKPNIPNLDTLSFIVLPSTSPSNTQNSFWILREWLQIRNYLGNDR